MRDIEVTGDVDIGAEVIGEVVNCSLVNDAEVMIDVVSCPLVKGDDVTLLVSNEEVTHEVVAGEEVILPVVAGGVKSIFHQSSKFCVGFIV